MVLGTCALDEASCRSKARNRAISFIPNKPDKFALRFYAVVGTSGPYIHSIWDNGRGNHNPLSQVERYNHLFKIFGTILMDVDDHHAYGLKSWLISYTKVPASKQHFANVRDIMFFLCFCFEIALSIAVQYLKFFGS